MRVISFMNEKGGCGKTTLTVNIGAYLASQGKKVLLVDMDPQGHIGKSLGINVRSIDISIFDVLLEDDIFLSDAIYETTTPNLDVVPTNKRLTDFVINVSKHNDRHLKLKNSFVGLDYDFVFIDAPPSLGLISINILMAINEVIIPVSLSFLALDGCAEMLDTIKTVKRNFDKKDLVISRVIATFYRETKLANKILEKLQHHFGDKLCKTILKFDVKIDQGQSFGKTIFEYSPYSAGAKMLEDIAIEVLKYDGRSSW
ncbi:MAG: ParA family protein [Nitrospinae bacterium]|nr:ParA family protein [Nitrospinota bacterium]